MAVIDVDDDDCFIIATRTTPLSSRGSTKRNAISVEDYDRDRHLHLRRRIYIDLDGDDDDDQNQSSTFDCEICVERKTLNESFRINGCSHSYCKECVSKYISSRLQNNILSIQCPVSPCTGRLEPEQCRKIIPREVFDRWGDALCEALVMSSSKKFYCPYKECSALMLLEEDKVKITETKCTETKCLHCSRTICVACGTKWHQGITCEEFQKMAEKEREKDDLLLKKMAAKKKWKRCPSCKFYIEKNKGCKHMTCRCGMQFCYTCEIPWKEHHDRYCRRRR